MNDIMCRYAGDREQALVAYAYGELEPAERVEFDAHLSTCARCRTELSAFTDVRGQLSRWAAPELRETMAVGGRQPSVGSRQSSVVSAASAVRQSNRGSSLATGPWPVWAQAAAAALVVGIGAGLANLDVRYDASGLHVRTGWMKAGPVAPASAAGLVTGDVATRTELAALEQRLRTELGGVRTARAAAASAPGATADVNAANDSSGAAPVSPELLRRLRALIDESERRQQRELALRVGELLRDVNAQRQADLARIDRSLGVIQNNTGVEMMRQRETLNNLLVRTSLQK